MNALIQSVDSIRQLITPEEVAEYIIIDDDESPSIIDAIIEEAQEVIDELGDNPESLPMDVDEQEESCEEAPKGPAFLGFDRMLVSLGEIIVSS